MHGIRIRAADEPQRRHMMRRHHARVARMKLPCPAAAPKLRGDLVDPLGDDQRGSFDRLGEKVAHRTIEAPRQYNALPILRYERERAFDRENGIRIIGEQTAPCFRFVDRPEPLRFRGNEVDDTRDRITHGGSYEGLSEKNLCTRLSDVSNADPLHLLSPARR